MNFKVIQKGNLTIALDTDYLALQRTRMLEIFDSLDEEDVETVTNKKNKMITREEYEEAVDRLFNLAIDIIDEKLGIDLFEYIPVTKAGLFHKSASTLLATSGIKDVWNGDYFSMKMMELRLVPVSFAEKINPFFALAQNGNLFSPVSGDGTVAYIELDWFSNSKKEEPIFDAMNVPKKIEKVRNKYLKLTDMKPGYTYFDAKGNEFLYVGNLWDDEQSWGSRFCQKIEIPDNKTDYLNSERREKVLVSRKQRLSYSDVKYGGHFYYMKMTKKNEALINSVSNIGELFESLITFESKYSWYSQFKYLENPMKVVSEGRKLLDSDLGDGYYYIEGNDEDGYLYKAFFYMEYAE